MGSAPTQGNLLAVRKRAEDLQKTIDQVIYALRFNSGLLKWDDIINKYSVINKQLASLREALRPGTLDGYALLPRVVPDAGFAEAVTVQLSSALTPEGEAAAVEAAAAVDEALGLGPPGQMPSMQRFEILNSAVEAHNGLISALTGTAGAGSEGPLCEQGPLRKRQREISDSTMGVLQAKARTQAAAAAALAAAASGPPAATTGGGRQVTAHASLVQRGRQQPGGVPTAAGPGGGVGGAGASEGPMDPALVFLLSGVRPGQ
ncbi:hypothetical protein HYH02_003207 [Chlamydomonas schloesseri]|uniref:Mediator of RNA polymerase II transcription subunit 8 n=1 Tax=Chlamydomonas schloesseri TaxID=2026947 RepID=A0A835WTA5_9CHLO|nr:hypothetical protein HYH02_003207 [Chlamydomonas schloesseri]|eukprot:KAG2452175.1 hypothetical protein HYH02_003207 [Chlamydomonas schloesseri]